MLLVSGGDLSLSSLECTDLFRSSIMCSGNALGVTFVSINEISSKVVPDPGKYLITELELLDRLLAIV